MVLFSEDAVKILPLIRDIKTYQEILGDKATFENYLAIEELTAG